jgi:hypothetical protein
MADEAKLFERLDEIIHLLKELSTPPSAARKIIDGLIIAVTILSVVSIIDILRQWLGG